MAKANPRSSIKRSISRKPAVVKPSAQKAARTKTAAIISRPDRPQVAQIFPALLEWFAEHGYTVIIDEQSAKYTTGLEILPRSEMASRPLDLVVVLGGDGTLLSAARATAATAKVFI